MQDTKIAKQSEKLTPREFAKFKKYVDSFRVKQDCANELGINRYIIERVYFKGSASPTTISKIRQHIAA